MMESSSSDSSKRTRPFPAAVCLVDGCAADLTKSREYHRRHKVCEPHAKSPFVTLQGRPMRFCQQCSRFQSLEEFDEGKRSCRKRLDGHNRRRRRKPHPSSFPSTYSSFFPSLHGVRYLQFSNPQSFSSHDSSPPINFMEANQIFLELASQTHKGENQYKYQYQFSQGSFESGRTHSLLSPWFRAPARQVAHLQPLDLTHPIFAGSHHGTSEGTTSGDGRVTNAENKD